jgi:hypothetical protein
LIEDLFGFFAGGVEVVGGRAGGEEDSRESWKESGDNGKETRHRSKRVEPEG